jgi:hypothetical protein
MKSLHEKFRNSNGNDNSGGGKRSITSNDAGNASSSVGAASLLSHSPSTVSAAGATILRSKITNKNETGNGNKKSLRETANKLLNIISTISTSTSTTIAVSNSSRGQEAHNNNNTNANTNTSTNTNTIGHHCDYEEKNIKHKQRQAALASRPVSGKTQEQNQKSFALFERKLAGVSLQERLGLRGRGAGGKKKDQLFDRLGDADVDAYGSRSHHQMRPIPGRALLLTTTMSRSMGHDRIITKCVLYLVVVHATTRHRTSILLIIIIILTPT